MTKLSSLKEDVIVLDFERENVHYHNTKCTLVLIDLHQNYEVMNEYILPLNKFWKGIACFPSTTKHKPTQTTNVCWTKGPS
jgi:hypothetical protein